LKNPSKPQAQKLYENLISRGIDVLYDDREEVSAGTKFNDADLLGIPVRLVISKKSLENGGIEYKERDQKETEIFSKTSLTAKLSK
jgi:prolyl-tRNA synthetase